MNNITNRVIDGIFKYRSDTGKYPDKIYLTKEQVLNIHLEMGDYFFSPLNIRMFDKVYGIPIHFI